MNVWTNATVAEAAWQLNQRFLHADYIGDEPDLFQLRRDLAELARLVHELAGGNVAEELAK